MDPLEESTRSFLTMLLQILLTKLKWDEQSDPDDSDVEEDDLAEFDKMRKASFSPPFLWKPILTIFKDLRVFLDSILSIDQELVTDAVRTLSLNTISAYQSGVTLKWNDAELGIYLVYIFGEINKGKF